MYEMCMLYMMLFQIRMNGLEAASIMRKELNYTGAIIGMLLGSLLGDHTYQIMSMSKFFSLFTIYRGDRQCAA